MTQSVNGDGLTAQLVLTDGAVNHVVVRTVGIAGSVLLVLNNSCTSGVILHGDLNGSAAQFIATDVAVNDGVVGADSSAGGILDVLGNCIASGVTQSINSDGLTAQLDATAGAVNNGVIRTGVLAISVLLVLHDRCSRAADVDGSCGKDGSQGQVTGNGSQAINLAIAVDIPADELIDVAVSCLAGSEGSNQSCTVLSSIGLFGTVAVNPGDLVLTDNSLVNGPVGDIAGDGGDVHNGTALGQGPADQNVIILCSGSLSGDHIALDPVAVANGLGSIHLAISTHPGDSVGVQLLGVQCGIGSTIGSSNDLVGYAVAVAIPAGQSIGILSIAVGGGDAFGLGHYTVSHVKGLGATLVLEGDLVRAHLPNCEQLCGLTQADHIAGLSHDLAVSGQAPTHEGCIFLGGNSVADSDDGIASLGQRGDVLGLDGAYAAIDVVAQHQVNQAGGTSGHPLISEGIINNDIICSSTDGLAEAAVSIGQQHGNSRNFDLGVLTGELVHIAVGGSTSLGILDHTGALGGNDLSTTGGTVDGSTCQQQAVHVDVSIGIDLTGRGLVAQAGDVLQNSLTTAAEYISTPLIDVENIDFLLSDQGRILGNIDTNTGLEQQLLGSSSSTAVDVDGEVTVDGQDILVGVDSHDASQGHANAVDGDGITVAVTNCAQDQTVLGRIIFLDQLGVAAGGEHTAIAQEGNEIADRIFTQQVNCSVNLQGSTGLQNGLSFHILYVVLVEEEGVIAAAGGNLQRDGTATVVQNLHLLINGSTASGIDSTLTDDITPSVEVSAVLQVDLRAFVQVDAAVLAVDAAAVNAVTMGGEMHSTDFHVAERIDLSTGCQSQGNVGSSLTEEVLVSRRINILGNGIIQDRSRLCHIGSVVRISGQIRNQQSDAGRNGVLTGDGDILQQPNDLAGAIGSSGSSCGQIAELCTANAKNAVASGDKHRSNGGILVEQGAVGQVSGQITVSRAVPACEGVAVSRSSSHGELVRSRGGNGAGNCYSSTGSVGNRVAAVGGCTKANSGAAQGGQLQSGEYDGCTVGRRHAQELGSLRHMQGDSNGLTGLQSLGSKFHIGSGRGILGFIHRNVAVFRTLGGNAVGKGQSGICGAVVGQRQGGGGFVVVLHRTAGILAANYTTVHVGTGGIPACNGGAATGSIGVGKAQVSDGTAGKISSGCSTGFQAQGEVHSRKERQDQSQSQD